MSHAFLVDGKQPVCSQLELVDLAQRFCLLDETRCDRVLTGSVEDRILVGIRVNSAQFTFAQLPWWSAQPQVCIAQIV